MSEELLARLSCSGSLFLCPTGAVSVDGTSRTFDCEHNAYGIRVHTVTLTDTVSLIIGFVAVLTWLFCRIFGVTVLMCSCYDLSPF